MEAPRITKLPTEMVCAVSSYLCMKDLRNFRQVSRWAERSCFNEFVARGFGSITIHTWRQYKDRLLLDLVQNGSHVAAHIKSLRINYSIPVAEDLADSELAPCKVKRIQAERDPGPKMSNQLQSLPKLETLTIQGFGPRDFAWHWPAPPSQALSEDTCRLHSLVITDCGLASLDLISLLHNVKALRLTTLKIHNSGIDDAWLGVLHAIRDSLAQLEVLSLASLRTPANIYSSMMLKAPGKDYYSTTRVNGRVQIVMVRQLVATMKGACAVKAGLDMIIQHIETTS
ncbi:hypothetical protein LTR27_009512 [Elasticomyces elasticus]|nr:hypothetical protein LTR27_009512 [Elasticomyces elasticus]